MSLKTPEIDHVFAMGGKFPLDFDIGHVKLGSNGNPFFHWNDVEWVEIDGVRFQKIDTRP